MGKSILYRLFGLGKLPRDVKSGLENEEIEFLDEGIRSSVTFKKFKAPGKRFYWRRNWFPGSFVVTNKRVAGFAYSKSLIDVTVRKPACSKSCTSKRRIRIAFSFVLRHRTFMPTEGERSSAGSRQKRPCSPWPCWNRKSETLFPESIRDLSGTFPKL